MPARLCWCAIAATLVGPAFGQTHYPIRFADTDLDWQLTPADSTTWLAEINAGGHLANASGDFESKYHSPPHAAILDSYADSYAWTQAYVNPVVPANFKVYWVGTAGSVTTIDWDDLRDDDGATTDDFINISLRAENIENGFGAMNNSVRLEHFLAPSRTGADYTQWKTNWAKNLADHLSLVESQILGNAGIQGGDYDYIAMDWEAFGFTANAQKRFRSSAWATWKDAVRAINLTQFSTAFINAVGYTPPPGATKFDDLSAVDRGEQDALAKAAWDYFVQILVLDTLDKAQTLEPTIAWSYYATIIPDINTSFSSHEWGPTSDPWDVSNDNLLWLLSEVDFIAPVLYSVPRHDPLGEHPVPPCSGLGESEERIMKYYAFALGEANRVRDAVSGVNPGVEVLPFIWMHSDSRLCGHYTDHAAAGLDPMPSRSGAEVKFLFHMLQWYGIDGALLWHNGNDHNGPTATTVVQPDGSVDLVHTTVHADSDEIEGFLLDRWRVPVNAMSVATPGER